jgi:hypothetical protein
VTDDQLQSVIEGTIGLSTVTGNLDSSLRAVATAAQGDFNMLQRYLVALKSTKDETEKMNIATEGLADLYQVATGRGGTLSFEFAKLTNTGGDFLEIIGEQLSDGLRLVDLFRRLKGSMEDWGQALVQNQDVKEFAEGVRAAAEVLGTIFEKILGGGPDAGQAVADLMSIMAGVFRVAGVAFIEALKAGASIVGALIGEAFMSFLPGIFKSSDASALKAEAQRLPDHLRERAEEVIYDANNILRTEIKPGEGPLMTEAEQAEELRIAARYVSTLLRGEGLTVGGRTQQIAAGEEVGALKAAFQAELDNLAQIGERYGLDVQDALTIGSPGNPVHVQVDNAEEVNGGAIQ